MFKYIHIIIFLITHDLTDLKEYWRVEFIKGSFSWRKILTRIIKKDDVNYMFWWRLVNNMYINGSKKQKKIASKIQKSLKQQYNVEVCLGAKIGVGFKVVHSIGVVINENVKIGKNFQILQNCTIGTNGKNIQIEIGDNVLVGANSVILGGELKIGNNVIIGAMSFVNSNIPDNCTVYTEKTNKLIYR